MRKFLQYWQMLRHLGPTWMGYRALHALNLRLGALRRRLPATSWEAQPLTDFVARTSDAEPDRVLRSLEDSHRFFFRPQDRPALARHFAEWDAAAANEGLPIPQETAERLLQGRLVCFTTLEVPAGFPPRWHCAPQAASGTNADLRHWTQIGDFEGGDIKWVWEPARFGFAFTLSRAYWRTSEPRFAEAFWQAVESWRQANPPQQGVHWKCGQECSVRALAWCFGLFAVLDSPATTPQRVAQLLQMLAVTAARIEANLSYALSQNNNHGVSEANGLWTIGVLFPQLKDAPRWRETGARVLSRLAEELIYDDGAFSQYSLNYHRVALQHYAWALNLARKADASELPESVRPRVRAAANFVYQLQDAASGEAPNYGANDGALLLPLSNAAGRDMRPAVQAALLASTGERAYPPGRWDEESVWLGGEASLDRPAAPLKHADYSAPHGGCHTLRAASGLAMLRAGRYRHRPSHADALHADIWWRGRNIALDPGTYSYNAEPPWCGALARTAAHNTVSVDDQDQMTKASRFLWLPWLHAEAQRFTVSGSDEIGYLEARHDGYQRLTDPVSHRRGVLRLGAEHWLVVDRLAAAKTHRYRLQWLLPDEPYEFDLSAERLELETEAGPYRVWFGASDARQWDVVRADPESPRGWRGATYSQRAPAVSLVGEAEAAVTHFVSLLGPPCRLACGGDRIEVQIAEGRCFEVELTRAAAGEPLAVQQPGWPSPLVRGVRICGSDRRWQAVDFEPHP